MNITYSIVSHTQWYNTATASGINISWEMLTGICILFLILVLIIIFFYKNRGQLITEAIESDNHQIQRAIKQCTSIIESINLTLFLLDKNKTILELYNVGDLEKIGISADSVEVGKHLRHYSTDKSSIFYHICNAIEQTIEKAIGTEPPVAYEYKVFNYYVKIIVSTINELILIQIKDITNIRQELSKMESSNYNELSMAMIAGNLTSWKYDIKTRMVSSSSNNTVTGEQIPFDELLMKLILPEYRESVLKMIDSIANHGAERGEVTIRSIDISGHVLWINIHAIPYAYNSNGEVTVIAGSQKDITHKYEYHQKINQLNKQNELILNNIKSALVYITPDYKVAWENVSIVFGQASANKYYTVGTYCYSAFNRETPCKNCVMQRAMQSGKSESDEITVEEKKTIEITANPILSADNKIDGIVLKIDDVTEKKEYIHKLKTLEQEATSISRLLYTILDHLPSYIFVKDVEDDYRYIISNKQLCDELGLPENQVLGKTDYDIFPAVEAAKYRCDDSDVIEKGLTKTTEEMVTMRDKIKVSHTIKMPLIHTSGNNKKLLVGIGMDITESHKAYQELIVAKKKAEESDKLKSAFLANMSHEIRTPLNAIVGFSRLLESCEDQEERAEYVRIISTNNELLLRLINDILDLSKLESGIIQFNNEKFDLVQFFDELSASMRKRISNPNIEFITINPYKNCIIETDKTRMTQVWHNFITNAIKYTVSGYIKMGYEAVDNGIKIYVEDTGIGIAEEKKCKLFHRFEKLDSFAQGTGLGLSICKAISELGGGKVGFESTEGKGSTFWSWKPLEVHKLIQ